MYLLLNQNFLVMVTPKKKFDIEFPNTEESEYGFEKSNINFLKNTINSIKY